MDEREPWVDSFHESVRPSGFHPIKTGPLVMGLLFGCVVVAWTLIQLKIIAVDDLSWLAPAMLVFAGGSGVVISLAGTRRR